MNKLSTAVGDIVAPIVFMVFVGYQVGQYLDKLAISMAIGLLVGFIVALFNVWKLMKKLRRNDE
ncbi:MAG: AtpZ/AtpI family protein [Alphaproteobacteria bacterium]|nr:AtpZ/AtpI family protein [Alphaproteobacteria bacterium]